MKTHMATACAAAWISAIVWSDPALAEIPVFSAQCPLDNYVDADRTGTVRVNGNVASVEEFNSNYYEARIGEYTFSISHEGGGRGLNISYTGPNRANGICTILASGSSQGSVANAESEPFTGTERVQFKPGTSSAERWERLTPGSSMRYVLGAGDGQELFVEIVPEGPDIYYQIFNPDGSFLLDQVSSDQEYRGQLWQSGDHVIEVINRGNSDAAYNAIIEIY